MKKTALSTDSTGDEGSFILNFSINIFVLLDTSKNTLICVNIVGIGKESLAY